MAPISQGFQRQLDLLLGCGCYACIYRYVQSMLCTTCKSSSFWICHLPWRLVHAPLTASHIAFSDQSRNPDEHRLTARLTESTMISSHYFCAVWEWTSGVHKATCTLSISPFSERPRSIASDNTNNTKLVYRSDVRRGIYYFYKWRRLIWLHVGLHSTL